MEVWLEEQGEGGTEAGVWEGIGASVASSSAGGDMQTREMRVEEGWV